MNQDFRVIPGHEDYEINRIGEVYSLKHGTRKAIKLAYIKGYPYARLCMHGVVKTIAIHRLVWETFEGPIPKGMCVLHGPGNNRANCDLNYLSLGTAADNHGRDRLRDGSDNRGEKHGCSKLTEDQVRYIKSRLNDGMEGKALAKLFNVGRAQISRIKNNLQWAHIQIS